MKFGAQINSFEADWEAISAYIAALEGGRWNSLWIADHFLPADRGPGRGARTGFEAFTLLSVAARHDPPGRARHAGAGQHLPQPGAGREDGGHPRSGVSRAAGAGDRRRLVRARARRLRLGLPFHGANGRTRLEEACKLIRTLFTAPGPVDFQGRYYRVEQAPLVPGCCRKPHIPILVGGIGERRTLRTLARYGDVFNLNGWAIEMSLAAYRRKAEVIERHCAAVGRDPAEIRHTIHMPLQLAGAGDRPPAGGSEWKLGPGLTPAPASFNRRPHRRTPRRGGGRDHLPAPPRRRLRAARRRGDRRRIRLTRRVSPEIRQRRPAGRAVRDLLDPRLRGSGGGAAGLGTGGMSARAIEGARHALQQGERSG